MDKETIRYDIPELSLFYNIDMSIEVNRPYRGMHFHTAAEFIRVNSGSVCCRVGSESFILEQGEVMYINARAIHCITPNAPYSKIDLLQIMPEAYISTNLSEDAKLLAEYIKHTKQTMLLRDEKSCAQACLIDKIVSELKKGEEGYKLFVKAHITELFALLWREGVLQAAEIGKEFDKIMPAISFINKNYPEKISLEEISATVYTNKYNFCKLFKSRVGGTFTDYVNFVRVRRATELLDEREKNITDIAFACGFSSLQYFGRVFFSQYGCSPATYRRLKR